MQLKERVRATRTVCLLISGSWANGKDVALRNKVQISWSDSTMEHPQCLLPIVSHKITGFHPNDYLVIQITLVSLKICALLPGSYALILSSRQECVDPLKAEEKVRLCLEEIHTKVSKRRMIRCLFFLEGGGGAKGEGERAS